MKRNGLVFVPPETPKRVILYPTQESASQQPTLNGQQNRARTALVMSTPHEPGQSSPNNTRLIRQPPLSGPPNGLTKPAPKTSKIDLFFILFSDDEDGFFSDHDEAIPLTNG